MAGVEVAGGEGSEDFEQERVFFSDSAGELDEFQVALRGLDAVLLEQEAEARDDFDQEVRVALAVSPSERGGEDDSRDAEGGGVEGGGLHCRMVAGG